MSFWVYILECSDRTLYVGQTDDLEIRIPKHHDGTYGGYTSDRRPVKLVYSAEFPTRDEAINREQQLKRWSAKKKRALIEGDWARVSILARGTDRDR